MNYGQVMKVYKSRPTLPLKHVPNIFWGAVIIALLCQFPTLT